MLIGAAHVRVSGKTPTTVNQRQNSFTILFVALLTIIGTTDCGPENPKRDHAVASYLDLVQLRRADFSSRVESDSLNFVGYLGIIKTIGQMEFVWTGEQGGSGSQLRLFDRGYILRRKHDPRNATVASAPEIVGTMAIAASYRDNSLSPTSVQYDEDVNTKIFGVNGSTGNTSAKTENMRRRMLDPMIREFRSSGVDFEFGPLENDHRTVSVNMIWPFPSYANSGESDRGYEPTFVNRDLPEARSLIRGNLFGKAVVALGTLAVNPPGWDDSSPIATESGYVIESHRVIARVTVMAMVSSGNPEMTLQFDALGDTKLPHFENLHTTGTIKGPVTVRSSTPTILSISYPNVYIKPERISR